MTKKLTYEEYLFQYFSGDEDKVVIHYDDSDLKEYYRQYERKIQRENM